MITKCDICGADRDRTYGVCGLRVCAKHYNQFKKYSKFLDTNPRTAKDPNKVRIDSDNKCAYIETYDKNLLPSGEFIIDLEDLELVSEYKWRIMDNSVKTDMNINGIRSSMILQYLILNIDPKLVYRIDYLNGNKLDFRKSNLSVVYDKNPTRRSQYRCDVCDRMFQKAYTIDGYRLCRYHYDQYKEHGRFLDKRHRRISDPNEFHFCGDTTYIDLYNGYGDVIAQAIIDTEDVAKIDNIKWSVSRGYASATVNGKTTKMHQLILPTDLFIDHINHNKLDNRKCNLRSVTNAQNMYNMDSKGIAYAKGGAGPFAYIRCNGKRYHLGTFKTEDEAIAARIVAEVYLFGEHRFPKELPDIDRTRLEEITEQVIARIDYINSSNFRKYKHGSNTNFVDLVK